VEPVLALPLFSLVLRILRVFLEILSAYAFDAFVSGFARAPPWTGAPVGETAI
jgi:hypothetical protein